MKDFFQMLQNNRWIGKFFFNFEIIEHILLSKLFIEYGQKVRCGMII